MSGRVQLAIIVLLIAGLIARELARAGGLATDRASRWRFNLALAALSVAAAGAVVDRVRALL